MITHEEQIENDLRLYGVAVEFINDKGVVERLDPTKVRYIKRTSVKRTSISDSSIAWDESGNKKVTY